MRKMLWILPAIIWQTCALTEAFCLLLVFLLHHLPRKYEAMTKNELLKEYCYSLSYQLKYLNQQLAVMQQAMDLTFSGKMDAGNRKRKELESVDPLEECASLYKDKSLAALTEHFGIIKKSGSTIDEDIGSILIEQKSGEVIRCDKLLSKQQ